MSIREIRSHNKYEIQIMLKALERFEIISNGQGMSAEMRKTSDGSVLWAKYVEETEKYKEQTGNRDG